jgi:predicted phage terminase large subunit-like protein
MLSSSEIEAVFRLPRAEKEKLLPTLEARAHAKKTEAEAVRRSAFEASIAQVRARCQTLAGFVREAWPNLEPNTPLVWNWHLDAICSHLEAVSNGQITRLLINVPPGSSKSMITSVMWPAWEWGPRGLPSMRYLTTSFNDGPVKRDTRKTRDLLASEWFRTLWPNVTLTRTGETSFANNQTGNREGVPFGSLTSQRGDRLIIDDPHSTKTAESDVERPRTVRQFQEGAINRLNDQTKSAIVVIMQRLHEDDVAGVILKSKMGFDHLCLPMEFEADRRCRTSIGFADPRTYDGELLDPIRFPREVIDRDFKVFGYSWAGQYQQRPAPREGGLFKRHWFEIVDAIPVEATRQVRSWDLGATKGGGDPTAGVKVRRVPAGRFYVEDVVREQFGPAEVERLIRATASRDGTACHITIPQDPGAAGKSYADTLILMLAGYPIKKISPTGDKQTRATPAAAQAEAGNIKLLRGPWNDAFLDEVCTFPAGSHDDQVDALSDAINELALGPAPGGVVKVNFG